jgi:hypothetical protein
VKKAFVAFESAPRFPALWAGSPTDLFHSLE